MIDTFEFTLHWFDFLYCTDKSRQTDDVVIKHVSNALTVGLDVIHERFQDAANPTCETETSGANLE